MPPSQDAQTTPTHPLTIGVDVGGTFTDLVASDGQSFSVLKLPSTPPEFHRAVVEAVTRAAAGRAAHVIHGSTVATNALLERRGEPVALITTAGFRDVLSIGRQNRPKLYALRIERPAPIVVPENCFEVRERIDAAGEFVEALDDAGLDRVVAEIVARGLRHVAVCLLFSFVNPAHERRVGDRCTSAGLAVSLSSDILPEFREYERASTVAVNAALRPIVGAYLAALESGLATEKRDGDVFSRDEKRDGDVVPRPPGMGGKRDGDVLPLGSGSSLRIMQSGGGTVSVAGARVHAAKLVLSGPAGGVIGAAYVARAAGFGDVITYDMGGTSTDVALVLDGSPQWTTGTAIDGLPIGLPIGLPMFDIHTVGAGGGSIAYVDAGGGLRVGPRSAGAQPGPACYGRGGTEPTVTDANLLLGRIVPDQLLGGSVRLDVNLAAAAVERVAKQINKSVIETALGIVRIAEANMSAAVRAVTSRRGQDPRDFALVSFGGAGGLHACAIAESLDIPRVLVPPYCGVLSALGMVVAPPVVDASQTVLHLGDTLDDERLPAEVGRLSGLTIDAIPYEQTAAVEVYADARFRGQSHEVRSRFMRPSLQHIHEQFLTAYEKLYGTPPVDRAIEIVTLRLRRIGRSLAPALPTIEPRDEGTAAVTIHQPDGTASAGVALSRAALLERGPQTGPLLLADPEATAYVPPGWRATAREDGSVILERI